MPKQPAKMLPFMSVVVITHNGSATIGRALESLLAQDYPKSRYEIIVIDDGSTDDTAVVAANYPVRYHYQLNGGISSARNAGLKLVKGDIYAAFDDDCIAHRDWLKQLATGYAKGNPAGVGGVIESATQSRNLIQRYMDVTGSGPAPSDGSEPRKSLPGRLLNYWTANFKRGITVMPPAVFPVGELYGANSSFPVRVLRAVGGWSTELSGIEDRALSKVIRQRFPRRQFFAVGQARISHEPDMTLASYLLRPWRRGPVNWAFHRQHGIVPPFFPLPFLYVMLMCLMAIWDLHVLPIAMIAIPQLLYAWWPHIALQRREISALLYPYLQLAEETMVIAGLLRGAVRQQRRAYARKTA